MTECCVQYCPGCGDTEVHLVPEMEETGGCAAVWSYWYGLKPGNRVSSRDADVIWCKGCGRVWAISSDTVDSVITAALRNTPGLLYPVVP